MNVRMHFLIHEIVITVYACITRIYDGEGPIHILKLSVCH